MLRWSIQRANGQYRDHLVGQLTTPRLSQGVYSRVDGQLVLPKGSCGISVCLCVTFFWEDDLIRARRSLGMMRRKVTDFLAVQIIWLFNSCSWKLISLWPIYTLFDRQASLSLCDKGAHSCQGWVALLLFGRFLHLLSILVSHKNFTSNYSFLFTWALYMCHALQEPTFCVFTQLWVTTNILITTNTITTTITKFTMITCQATSVH